MLIQSYPNYCKLKINDRPNWLLEDLSECSIWWLWIISGCCTETVHIWPYVDKAKMCLRGGRSFRVFRNLFTFSAVCLWFFKKICHLLNTFWLYQHGANMHRFCATVVYFSQLLNGTPYLSILHLQYFLPLKVEILHGIWRISC